MIKLKDIFEQKNICVCEEGLDWLQDKTLEEMWAECKRGDWMLWTYAVLYPNNKRELTLARGHCANTVRYLMKDKGSISAVDAAIAFGEGRIDRGELKAAASAAYAASYAAASAAYAAPDAAFYAASAAAHAAFYSARKKKQKETADICRKYLSVSSDDFEGGEEKEEEVNNETI